MVEVVAVALKIVVVVMMMMVVVVVVVVVVVLVEEVVVILFIYLKVSSPFSPHHFLHFTFSIGMYG